MKKLISLMLLLATMLTFTACGDDEPKNTLKGTTWVASYGDDTFVIEFESDTKVSGFRGDSNGNIEGSLKNGTYSLSGDRVILTDLAIARYYTFHFTGGTVSGNYMTLDYWYEMGSPDNKKRFDDQMTFRKK